MFIYVLFNRNIFKGFTYVVAIILASPEIENVMCGC